MQDSLIGREKDKFKAVGEETAVNVNLLNQFVPEKFDELVLSYTGDDLTRVVYKLATVTVVILTLSYTGGKLTGVIKS